MDRIRPVGSPTVGKVYLFDQDIAAIRLEEAATKRAVLAQITHLNFAFEVLEVVMMGRIPYAKKQSADLVDDAKISLKMIEKVGLSGFEKRNYLNLSGGEQQRTHLARVLAQLVNDCTDKILFLDEPTASLDISHQHNTLKIAKDFCAEGGAVFAILHDLNLAAEYADKILLLAGEGKYLFGSPEDVLTSEHLTEAYRHEVRVIDHPFKKRKLILT